MRRHRQAACPALVTPHQFPLYTRRHTDSDRHHQHLTVRA